MKTSNNYIKKFKDSLENGEVFSWGDGQYGQLGLGSFEAKWEPNKILFNEGNNVGKIELSCGSHHTIILKGIIIHRYKTK